MLTCDRCGIEVDPEHLSVCTLASGHDVPLCADRSRCDANIGARALVEALTHASQ